MALQLHNYYRSIHEAPLLSLDSNLEKDAQEYAENVAKANSYDQNKTLYSHPRMKGKIWALGAQLQNLTLLRH